ncbi:hypothetical protein NQ318_010837 [Aromia moschata]|uniref:Pro-resilin n=1 Tax=Aromia moschata TaxID=1265417 RepID=A0AAV8YIA7_9CUCU|nr:hypothetical protein NQ318_010837 [Aromia moschata]
MNKITFVAVFGLVTITKSEPPSNDYGTPLGAPVSSNETPNYHATDSGGHGDGEPKSYEFGYQVKDDYTGTNYNRRESSDGNQVRGEYRVALPDGRIQIVTYWADWQTGFHADVRYEGEAQYPEQYNKGDYGGGGQNDEGYNDGTFNQYGAPSFHSGGSAAANSIAINNLASSHDDYNNYNYNNGYNSKSPPSNTYGAI